MKKTFIFSQEWKEAIAILPDDIRLVIYESIIDYATSGIVPRLSPMASIAFNFIKLDIDKNSELYEKTCARNRENGKNGGRPKTTQKPKKPTGFSDNPKNPQKPKKPDNDYDDDNDLNYDNDLKKTSTDVDVKKEANKTILIEKIEIVKNTVLSNEFQSSKNALCLNAQISHDDFEHYAGLVFDDWKSRIMDGKRCDIDTTHFRYQFPSTVRAHLPPETKSDWRQNLINSSIEECRKI